MLTQAGDGVCRTQPESPVFFLKMAREGFPNHAVTQVTHYSTSEFTEPAALDTLYYDIAS